MSFNTISRARNLLKEARECIGNVQLDPEAYGSVLLLLCQVQDTLAAADATWRVPAKRRKKANMLASRDRIRLRYLTLKLRALCWVLRRLRAGRKL